MNRREALEKVSWMLGGSIIGAQAFLNSSFTFPLTKNFFAENWTLYLNEVGETIFPETDTPGAKAANVGEIMQVIVNDCYTEADQKIFYDGLKDLEKQCIDHFGRGFMMCTAEQRTAFLTNLEKDHREYMKNKKSTDPVHYFRMLKELTLMGYFTSETGAVNFLRYNPAPGRYDGCTTEKPWK
jgi:hypothetical protein